MGNNILLQLQKAKQSNQKLLAILLDPDKLSLEELPKKIELINERNVDFILVGGSLLFTDELDELVKEIKKQTSIPVILFPGSVIQISKSADAILYLQLISGRNPDFLIGNQVIAAPLLKRTALEILSTGYILTESGRETTASYMSNSKPIPAHKPEIAMATALAGQYIGNQLIYMDGGSGALHPVPTEMIELVANNIELPIIIGGGIRNKTQLEAAYKAGATLVVIGTAFEDNAALFEHI